METHLSQVKKEAIKIRLSAREQADMRDALLAEMRLGKRHTSPIRLTPSPLLFFSPRLVSSLAFTLVLALVGGSTAYAAEGAVPGDLLYPIKVNLNEEVRAALAISTEAKAQWHAEAAERRMKEAQVLAVRGTLTADASEMLEANFEKHIAEVETVVRAVEGEDPVGAADITARLGSALEAHSAVIARLAGDAKDQESRKEAEHLSRSLQERGKKIARAETRLALKAGAISPEVATDSDVESRVALVAPADEAVTARIELTASTTLEEAESYLAALKSRLDATTSARTKAQISKIRDFLKKQGEEKNGRANVNAERALKDAVRVKAFIEAQDTFRDHALLPAPDFDEKDDAKKVEEVRDLPGKHNANEEEGSVLPILPL